MVEVKDLIQEAEKDNLGISSQAQSMLMKSDNPLENTKKLIEYAKQKRMIIAGGDVLRFIAQGNIPTSIQTSDDVDNIETKLIRIEQLILNMNKVVK